MRLDEMLGDPLEQFIETEVASGRYRNAGEVIRTALRLLQMQEGTAEPGKLRDEIRAGLESGPAIPASEVFAELRARYKTLSPVKTPE